MPWIKRWRNGFGFMGEQGAESIHAYFNGLVARYRSVPNPVKQMECIMSEHLLHIAPANIVAKPTIKKKTYSSGKVTATYFSNTMYI